MQKHTLGYIGLGKMGLNMSTHLIQKGWNVVGFDPNEKQTEALTRAGGKGVRSISEVLDTIEEEARTIWIMVPHTFVEDVLKELTPLLSAGDTVIDGGNSPYEESMRRGKELSDQGIHFLDAGISGGPDGVAQANASVMVGGEKDVYDAHEQLFADIAAENGYEYMGKSGAGHFVKMVHNGIEYGMMQAIAEGFHIMKCAPFELDLKDIARVYNHGSVIESRLMGWLESGYAQYGQNLADVTGKASHSGEGEWTTQAAHELGISDTVIHESLKAREASQTNPNYQAQVVSVLRNQFGGHDVSKS